MAMKDSFGSVKIFGRKYENDVVIHIDGNITKRKKKRSRDLKPIYGHTPLSEKELGFLEAEKPTVIYVGTGYEAGLPVTEGAKKILGKYETIMMPTPEIIEKIEHEQRDAVAIIHVTC